MDAHSGFVWGLSAPGSIPSLNPAQILPLFMLVWKMLGVLVTDVAKAEQIQVMVWCSTVGAGPGPTEPGNLYNIAKD